MNLKDLEEQVEAEEAEAICSAGDDDEDEDEDDEEEMEVSLSNALSILQDAAPLLDRACKMKSLAPAFREECYELAIEIYGFLKDFDAEDEEPGEDELNDPDEAVTEMLPLSANRDRETIRRIHLG